MNKKSLWKLIVILLLITIGLKLFVLTKMDAKRFKKEYPLVSENNKFVYKDIKSIINILKDGTGIVYFGFPEGPWCQEYVNFLDEAANESDLKEIYYINILFDRKNNTKEYQEIVNILKENLNLDDGDNPRIFVPHVVAVKEGKIILNDNETSTLDSDISPKDYWTGDKIDNIKVIFDEMIEKVNLKICVDCNQ